MNALSPCKIGTCEIKNRFVMTAANLGWCEDGFVTDDVIAFYRKRAEGQTGLLIVGAAGVDPERVNQVRMMQICRDCYIPRMKKLVDAVHEEGSRIFVQLMHAGAYARREEHGGIPAVAPSAYRCNFTGEMTKELSVKEISRIITCFKKAAARAQASGFDGIELMGSAGYLIAEFLSRATNHRNDCYGGDVAGRAKFLLEIIGAVREAVGEAYPVIVRLSGSDFISDGNSFREFVEIGKLIEEKVDAIDVTGGWHESGVPQITGNVPHGMYLYLAKAMKDAVNIPVIGCNRLEAESGAYAIAHGYCDMAGVLRGLIADPDLVKKWSEGKGDAIRPCLACNQGCLEPIFSGARLGCAINPFAGREAEELCIREKDKSILVIGAGVSGMAYAALAAPQNKVTVWEKRMGYGGMGSVVAKIPGKEDVRDYLDYLFCRCVRRGVEFYWAKTGCAAQIRELLEKKKIDKVVIATGGIRKMPDCERTDDAPVYPAEECIRGKVRTECKVVVTGGGYQAVQTALYLAKAAKAGEKEQEFLDKFAPEHLEFASDTMNWGNPSITILAPTKRIGYGFGKSTRFMMLKEIERNGIAVITEAEVRRMEKHQVIYQVGGKKLALPADMIVVGEGWQKNDGLLSELSAFAAQVEIIGDARRPGRIAEAVKDAFAAAMDKKEEGKMQSIL